MRSGADRPSKPGQTPSLSRKDLCMSRYCFLNSIGQTTIIKKIDDSSSWTLIIRPLVWLEKHISWFFHLNTHFEAIFWPKTHRKHHKSLFTPKSQKHRPKTHNKIKIKNLLELICDFLVIFKETKHLVLTPPIILNNLHKNRSFWWLNSSSTIIFSF
jgi:hypothetical protein